ncbi:uncharacterized protein LOC130625455 [Hydractinia symbiolongicarpus]|uniref:uncharacterized protein LOC130625455 n=1 Tax=Hydractinia symbiolongicarpus TaxID=13093 RepID=UPI00254E287C|nr:uncharacterized protein LOC130625455 [Hydractinia symbiolongicarpus]
MAFQGNSGAQLSVVQTQSLGMQENVQQPLSITEQPSSYGHTYRYSNERRDGKAYGHIKGRRGPYPKVKLNPCFQHGKVILSLVDSNHQLHPYSSIRKDRSGQQSENIDFHVYDIGQKELELDLCIQALKRQNDSNNRAEMDSKRSMLVRRMNCVYKSASFINDYALNDCDAYNYASMMNNSYEISDVNNQNWLKEAAEQQAKETDLNKCHLRFQLVLQSVDGRFIYYPPIFSSVIINARCKSGADMNIMAFHVIQKEIVGPAKGGTEIQVNCSNVDAEDAVICVHDGENTLEPSWKKFVPINKVDIHKNTSFKFIMPPYRDGKTVEPKKVFIELQRKSNKDWHSQKRIEFIYQPNDEDDYHIGAKRRKTCDPSPIDPSSAGDRLRYAGNFRTLSDSIIEYFNTPRQTSSQLDQQDVDITYATTGNKSNNLFGNRIFHQPNEHQLDDTCGSTNLIAASSIAMPGQTFDKSNDVINHLDELLNAPQFNLDASQKIREPNSMLYPGQPKYFQQIQNNLLTPLKPLQQCQNEQLEQLSSEQSRVVVLNEKSIKAQQLQQTQHPTQYAQDMPQQQIVEGVMPGQEPVDNINQSHILLQQQVVEGSNIVMPAVSHSTSQMVIENQYVEADVPDAEKTYNDAEKSANVYDEKLKSLQSFLHEQNSPFNLSESDLNFYWSSNNNAENRSFEEYL